MSLEAVSETSARRFAGIGRGVMIERALTLRQHLEAGFDQMAFDAFQSAAIPRKTKFDGVVHALDHRASPVVQLHIHQL